jgi:ABC-type multidrug transport system ATPase subunit
MSNILLKIVNLSKIYNSKNEIVKALDGVNLNIHSGEIISLLGPNGAGKTTLSSIIATLHPATKGDVLYKGQSIYKNIVSYRKILGFCPQKPNLDLFLDVEQNLIFAGRYFLIPEDIIRERVAKLMEQLSLTRYAKFNINELSGGTKQRVLIARALINDPEIVIFDEPTVGLDPDIRHQLWKIIESLKARGITVILTTHYLDEAEKLSDRVCIMRKGKILLTESVKELKEKHKKERLEEIFLQLLEEEEKQI